MTEKSEQPDVESTDASSLKSLDDFKSMPLDAMEKELISKDYSKFGKETATEEQSQEDSETSEDASETDETTNDQTSEQASEDESEASDDSSESEQASDNQKKERSNEKKDSKFDYEKAYKELQAEFTRRSQKLKELEDKFNTLQQNSTKTPDKKDEGEKPSRLAQLRKKDPEAAALLEEMIQEQVEKRVNDRVKPVEEQVTLRTRKENATKFAQAIGEFQKSELASLEPQLLAIYNENPDKWQRIIWDSEDAFEQLHKELVYRHLDKVAELKAKKVKESQSSSTKKDRLKESQVGTKTKVTNSTKDVMSADDFRKLSLEEMEKRLPKIRN